MSKRLFLTIGAVVVWTAPGSTFAQTAAATDSADFAGLEEVVVTAQRREENLQKAAVAVTAISADELVNGGVTEAQALNNLVPALSIAAAAGSATQVSIRGVGNFAGNAFAEQAVAMNLDGVYLARPAGVSGLFYDLERVEVLKGPQGTLYGRNATAGAVNIVTKKPIGEFGGEGSVEVGNYNLRRGFGALNVPLSDSVAMRAAFQVSKRDGYLSDGYGDDDGKAGRLTFKFDPTADLSILLTGDYFDQSGKGSAAVITPYANPGDPYTGPSTSSGNTILNLAGLPPIGDDGFLDNKYWGVTGSLDWQTSAGTLTIIPAYRSTRLNYLHYAAGFPVSNTEDDKQQSLEVRFASNDEGALRWLVGAYGFQEDIDFALLADQAVTSSYVAIPDLKSQSWAAFTQVTFAATDTLRLVGGLRYNHDRKEQEGTRTAPLPVGPPPAIVCPAPATVSGANCVAPVVGDADWSKLTWKAGVEIDVAPQSLLYFNVGTGFRAGGFFPSLAPNTFDPEQLLAYTLGSKNRFFDSTLQFNAEAYYWKYKDKQTTHLGPVSPAGFDLITENAGNATIYGIDTETLWLVTAQDQVAVQLQYEHSKYDDFRYNQFSGAPIGQPVTACATATTGSITAVDCSGRPLPLTPEWVAILAYDHTFALPDDAQVVFGLSSRYETSKWLANEYVAGEYQGSSHKTDVDVSYRSPQKIWSITAYVRNIEDAAVKSSTFVQPIIGVPFVVQQPPRTYGMRVAARF